MLRDFPTLNPGELINTKKRLPVMANIGGGNQANNIWEIWWYLHYPSNQQKWLTTGEKNWKREYYKMAVPSVQGIVETQMEISEPENHLICTLR